MRGGVGSKALWLAALFPLLAASVLPTQIRTLVCRLSGAVMQLEKCCPEKVVGELQVEAQLRDETCCVVKTVDLGRLLSQGRSDGASPRIPAVVVVDIGPSFVQPVLDVRRERPVGPPPVGPPLILLKRSFLI
jgi:hypothetical protein